MEEGHRLCWTPVVGGIDEAHIEVDAAKQELHLPAQGDRIAAGPAYWLLREHSLFGAQVCALRIVVIVNGG